MIPVQAAEQAVERARLVRHRDDVHVFGAKEDFLRVVTPLGDMVGESGEYDARAAGHAN